MRRILQKYGFLLSLTGIFLAFVLYCVMQLDIQPFYAQLKSIDGPVRINPYLSESGMQYLFLPSYADMKDLTLHSSVGQSVSVNGKLISEIENCDAFELGMDYPLDIRGEEPSGICFLRSANVAALHLETRSGNMEYVHDDKNNEESVTVRLFDAAGNLDFADEGGTIKGRGNATWHQDKKPYQLTLSQDSSLLGMAQASKWVLLANAMDESNLHNKVVCDLAAELDMEWAPQCVYVDVYLNGEYNGLYLLSEKVEIGENRLDIDTASGDFLCKVDLEDRWDTLRNPVETGLGRTVEITAPELFTSEAKEEILTQIGQLENMISSGAELDKEPRINLDSWVCRYLIDEISGNIDADVASSYFYRQGDVFYAGPVWDYDMTFGIHHRGRFPNAFIAKNRIKSSDLTSDYYAALYENPSFYKIMVQTYQERFLPVLERLVDREIQIMADRIASATAMNSLRWRTMFDAQYVPMGLIPSNSESVIAYLRERMAFLNSAWIEGETYYSVQYELEKDRSYGTVSVKSGEHLVIPDQDVQQYEWYIAETGMRFDPDQPIVKDMLLLLR